MFFGHYNNCMIWNNVRTIYNNFILVNLKKVKMLYCDIFSDMLTITHLTYSCLSDFLTITQFN